MSAHSLALSKYKLQQFQKVVLCRIEYRAAPAAWGGLAQPLLAASNLLPKHPTPKPQNRACQNRKISVSFLTISVHESCRLCLSRTPCAITRSLSFYKSVPT